MLVVCYGMECKTGTYFIEMVNNSQTKYLRSAILIQFELAAQLYLFDST